MAILDEALAQIPGYERATAAAKHAAKYKSLKAPVKADAQSAMTQSVQAEVLRSIGELMASGDEIPADIAQRIIDAEDADRLARRRDDLIGHAARDVLQDTESMVVDGADDALKFLHQRLMTTIDTVLSHVDVLDGVEDPTSALTGGPETAAAWASIAKLTDTYDEIRAAQSNLTNRVLGGFDRNHDFWWNTVGLYRDAIAVSPFFQDRRLALAAELRRGHSQPGGAYVTPHQTELAFADWLSDLPPRVGSTADQETLSKTHRWWDGGDRVIELIRIAQHSNPWVPDTGRISNAWGAAIGATRNVPSSLDAAHRYRQITGWTDMPLPDSRPLSSQTKAAKAAQLKQDRKLAQAASVAEIRREQREHTARANEIRD